MTSKELKQLCRYTRDKSVAFHAETRLADGKSIVTQPYTVFFNHRPVRTIFHYYLLDNAGRTLVENTSAETFARVCMQSVFSKETGVVSDCSKHAHSALNGACEV